MKYRLLSFLLLIGYFAQGQTHPVPIVRTPASIIATDMNVKAGHVLIIPVVPDTATALSYGVDSLGMLIQLKNTGTLYRRDTIPWLGGGRFWNPIGSGGGGGSFDSLTSQGGNFHTNPYNDVRYVKRSDSTVLTGYASLGNLGKIRDSFGVVIAGVNTAVAGKQAALSNGGSGFRVYLPGGTIKTLVCSGCTIDSATTGTLTITVTGGGGGSPNSNIGSGYRLAVPFTNNIKSIFCVNCSIDSTTNTNALTVKIDSALFATNANVQKKIDSFGNTVINTASNDRTATPSDSTMYPDIAGNIHFRSIRIHSTTATVTVNESASTAGGLDFDLSAAAGGSSPPFNDGTANPLMQNTSTSTKKIAFDLSGMPTSTTLDSFPSTPTMLAGTNAAQNWQQPQNFLFGSTFGGNWVPNANGVSNVGSGANNAATIFTHSIQSNGGLTYGIPTGATYGWNINSHQQFAILPTGQLFDSAYIGNVFAGTVTGGNPDSLMTINNGSVKKIPASAIGGSITRQSITSGTTATGTTITSGKLIVTYNFTTTAATFNFTMPPSAFDGEVVEFESGGTLSFPAYEVTTMTVTANSGQAFGQTQALTTIQANEPASWTYNLSLNLWMRRL